MKPSLIWILLLLAVLALMGCTGRAQPMPTGSVQPLPAAEGEELMATVSSQEEAEEIAALYGIELVSCSEHIATFHTEENPQTVIQRGKDNGWPLLEVNYVITLDDPVRHAPDKGSKGSKGN